MRQIAVKARVRGQVQGVSFRAWTQSRATYHQLQGWIIKEPFGSVCAVFEGEARNVQHMLDELWEGPAAAEVKDVQSSEIPVSELSDGFRILH